MTNQGHLKALPDPGSLALRIVTKSAFLASRTAKDAAISTLAQQSAEHTHLQEVHRELIAQLEQKESQILDLREIAAKAQSVSTERELELQHAAKTARSALSEEEAEHARLKERYQVCIAEFERKDAEIFSLHSKIKALPKKYNGAAHAAHVTLREHEVELSHVRTFFEERDTELEQKSSQITELDGTIERLVRECSGLKERSCFSQMQHEAEMGRLQGLLHQQTTQIEAKEAQILEFQRNSESLAQENNNLKAKAARVNDTLAAITQDLKDVTTEASAKITAAKAAADQQVARLLVTIEALEKDALRSKKQWRDATQTQSQTEKKRRDAVDMMLEVQATSDQLKHNNALLAAEVDNLQARKESLARTLANSGEVHERTREELRNATATVSGLRTSEAEARSANAVLTARVKHLELNNQALARREQMRFEHPPPNTRPTNQTHGTQSVQEPAQQSFAYDDDELCDWDAAKASGTFDFWSDNLHGSEIMALISIEEVGSNSSIACISKLIFDQKSGGLVAWLTQRHQDRHFEARCLNIVHLLNDALGLYGCACHRMHVYPDGSHDQSVHVRYALELLRAYGRVEHVSSLLVAVLSCFSGRSCLETLVEFDIHLDCSDCDLLTQRCQDKLRRAVS